VLNRTAAWAKLTSFFALRGLKQKGGWRRRLLGLCLVGSPPFDRHWRLVTHLLWPPFAIVGAILLAFATSSGRSGASATLSSRYVQNLMDPKSSILNHLHRRRSDACAPCADSRHNLWNLSPSAPAPVWCHPYLHFPTPRLTETQRQAGHVWRREFN
jgi:hypothetical protein